MPGDVGVWRRERDAVRDAGLAEGYDREVGAFEQAFGSRALDASNLLLPTMGFLPFDDPWVQGTIDQTLERLTENCLVHHYVADDGLPEGSWHWWRGPAGDLFSGMAERANHLGLYAEEVDVRTGAFLGNFPETDRSYGVIISSNRALHLTRPASIARQPRDPVLAGSA